MHTSKFEPNYSYNCTYALCSYQLALNQLFISFSSAVGQLFVNCSSAFHLLLVSCSSAVGQLLVSCWSTVHQLFIFWDVFILLKAFRYVFLLNVPSRVIWDFTCWAVCSKWFTWFIFMLNIFFFYWPKCYTTDIFYAIHLYKKSVFLILILGLNEVFWFSLGNCLKNK